MSTNTAVLKNYKIFIWCVIKLAVMYSLFKIYPIYVSSSLPSDGINSAAICTYAFLLVSHLAVQLIYLKNTVIGTKNFVFWQIVFLAGILMARSYVLLGEMVNGTPLSVIVGYVAQQLPYFIAFHAPIQAVSLIVFYHLERRRQVQAL